MPKVSSSTGLSVRELSPFEGAWKITGKAYDSPFGSNATVSAYETFEWLSGEQFLIHHLDGRFDGGPLACIEVLGRDPAHGAFSAHAFYQDGSANVWRLNRRSTGWVMAGEWSADDQTFAVRCTIVFDDRAHRRGIWEYSTDGTNWRVFWQTEAVRV